MILEHFNGRVGIRKLFEKTLLNNKEKIILTILSSDPLIYLAGEDFAQKYMLQRCKAGIFLKSLRLLLKKTDTPEPKEDRDYKKYYKQVRIAPRTLKIKDSLVIWDDYVAIVTIKYLNKKTESISSVLINNKENAAIMKKLFDCVWMQSKNPQYL